jgi:adenosylcobinamide-phosphate synthase
VTRGDRIGQVALGSSLLIDGIVGDPAIPLHPTALAGRALAHGYAPFARRGPAAALLGGTLALGGVITAGSFLATTWERLCRGSSFGALGLGLALKPTFARVQLLREGLAVATLLEHDDLPAARARVATIVSRPTAELGAAALAAATIESLAENLTDAFVAPLLAFAVAGLGGAAAYRVLNTADAMFGYRDEREWLGKSAARADDVANLLPSRLAALAIVLAAGLLSGRRAAASAAATARRDHRLLAGPNPGWTIAAMAGAVERRLEKPGHYAVGAEWPAPTGIDVRRATRIADLASGLVAVSTLGALAC